MGIDELKYKGKVFTNSNQIINLLKSLEFYWLIDSETISAKIEIENNTLIWHSGRFMSGRWYYGIFKDGHFYGTWENGIWENGYFDGIWLSGVGNPHKK